MGARARLPLRWCEGGRLYSLRACEHGLPAPLFHGRFFVLVTICLGVKMRFRCTAFLVSKHFLISPKQGWRATRSCGIGDQYSAFAGGKAARRVRSFGVLSSLR